MIRPLASHRVPDWVRATATCYREPVSFVEFLPNDEYALLDTNGVLIDVVWQKFGRSTPQLLAAKLPASHIVGIFICLLWPLLIVLPWVWFSSGSLGAAIVVGMLANGLWLLLWKIFS